MQTQEQVVPIRTPETSYGDGVITVIGPDGKARGEHDPKLPKESRAADREDPHTHLQC